MTLLFLVAAPFYPRSELPEWGEVLGNRNPLHHCVELVRPAAFGWEGWTDLARVVALAVFGLAVWRVAIRAMTRKLVD